MLKITRHEPLSKWTTLGLGGPAKLLCEVSEPGDLKKVNEIARKDGLPLRVLGGGSNLVVADAGVHALILRPNFQKIQWEDRGDDVLVRAGTGLDLDELVAESCRRGLWGLENLSGIPGTVGAAPVQNVGAYGVEISQLIEDIEVFELHNQRIRRMDPKECGFAYRNSVFRKNPSSFLITRISLRLSRRPRPKLDYWDLTQLEWPQDPAPTLIRERVLAIRRSKGMLIEDASKNKWRSAGSFFTNPVLKLSDLNHIQQGSSSLIPFRKMSDGSIKLSAAWLIEESGFERGFRRGAVGISPYHALALVHFGGGLSSDLMQLARDIQIAVVKKFDLLLKPEPVFWGFQEDHPLEVKRR